MLFEEVIRHFPALIAVIFTAILFIQSGFDKVFDWKGNLEWLTGHFSKTIFATTVPVMIATITVMEIATGLLAAAGAIYFLVTGSLIIVFYAAALGASTLTALFFGQRIAKDYPGAASIVPYFILMLIILFLTSPNP